MQSCRFFLLAFVIFNCLTASAQLQKTVPVTDSLYDAARRRPIPLLIYGAGQTDKLRPAIISHGYGGGYGAYAFIAEYLVANGYYVISIQHDLPGDTAMPTAGKPYEVRMPFWKRGAESILFVINDLKEKQPGLDYKNMLLIGHSNGGDMSMLFAREHPQLVANVISLDNRRMPFPRASRPRILSLRSSDQPADSGVIPGATELARYRMQVVKLPATRHNDMWDGATDAQKMEMLGYIRTFLHLKD
ncbi:alpha/beta hydrolase [Chitinophaga lutea]|uniref:Alpha/beta hydrolase n=1 Tax=Chitinophaga lutea TaxID=2488634 RepID=A0A3N4PBF4_9BACT|nr:alpha/beta fold hydrolase [Chitinophaga lutea]RPE05973.1 alpha/beta hydrolase [Chitinophaga lutea]